MILEDDVEFSYSNEKLLTLVQKLPKDWECVLLGHHSKFSRDDDGVASFWLRTKITDNHKAVRFVDRVAGGYAYLLNPKGAKKWLNNYKLITEPTDCWDSDKINLYGVYPAIFHISQKYQVGSLLDQERGSQVSVVGNVQLFKDKIQMIMKVTKLWPLYVFSRNLILKVKQIKPY